jgi:hypothetical protein
MSEQYAIGFKDLIDYLEHQYGRNVEMDWYKYTRLFSDPIQERGHWGDRYPCVVCGRYGYGPVDGDALCVVDWLEKRQSTPGGDDEGEERT